MAVNEMSFNQAATVLNSVVTQATGKAAMTPTNTYEFVTVAQTALKTGYDPILNAVNQVLSRTIFSVRPYTRKFRGMEVSESAWGNHVRKLSIADKTFSEDDRYKYPVAFATGQTPPSGDGKSVDQYAINKPEILQTNFYGQNVFQDSITIFKDQLDCAFRGPDEFSQFVSMVMGNMSDRLEQARENMARATIANFIGGVLDEGNTSRVIHLLTEYNTQTGLTLTAQNVYAPENFKAFVQWVYARVAAVCSLFTERSEMFQTVVNGKHIMRHTPYNKQRVYLYAPARFQMEQMAIADVYHDTFLKMADTETVNFWQSIETPDSVNVTPSYTHTNGTVKKGDAVNKAGIFGVITDAETMGYATTQQWSRPTPFNARGGYSNIWFHETTRNWNDNTEKGVVLLLD